MINEPLKLGFLASGNGTSARAIIAAIQSGDLAAEACVLVSNNRSAPALSFAADAGVPAHCVPTQADPAAADRRLARLLYDHGVNLLILSGYLRQLGPAVLNRFAGRILNIHPGPLPEFGGHGMYGRKVHEAVIKAGVAQSAACIHLVDEEYDRGPEIARLTIPVLAGDTAESLEARVSAAEPAFYVETLRRIAEGTLRPAPAQHL